MTDLHPRERQVLESLARGLTLQDIAAEQRYSIHTIKSRAERLYEKLGVRTQGHAVAVGYQRGLLRLPAGVPGG